MRFSRARYVTLCQQSLVTAAVLAVGVSAAGVSSLDIVPQPGTSAGVGETGPGTRPQQGQQGGSGQAPASQRRDSPPTKVVAAPVTPKVREFKVRGIADRAETPSAGATAPAPDLPDGEQETGGSAGAAAKRVVAFSAPRPVRGYATVGVTWKNVADYAPGQIAVEVRTQNDGTWSQWSPANYDDEHSPDRGSSEDSGRVERAGTDAVVIGDVDRVQMRAETSDASTPPDLRLAVIDPGRGSLTKQAPAIDTAASPTTRPATAGPTPDSTATRRAEGAQALSTESGSRVDTVALSAMTTAPQPQIFSRAQWGANERLREQSAPGYGTVRTGFVHHTVNANNYTAAQVPALLRGIYAYHTQAKGWRDIGYNFLVDRFGRVWEGRYGGVSKAVVGAHTSGYNESSFAMSAIGNFDTAAPPQAMLDAYARLFAWKLSLSGIRADATGLRVNGRTLRGINGHRDAGTTACPGRYLYAKLPTIRAAAQRIQDAAQSGTPPPKPSPTPTPAPTPTPTQSTFTSPTQHPQPARTQPAITFPKSLNLAGDSRPDLVVRSASGAVQVIPTGGQTGYRTAGSTAGSWNTMDLIAAVGDVTGDGKGDVLARLAKDKVTRVYTGNGAGGFKIPGTVPTRRFRGANLLVSAGDWNRDGRSDVLTRNAASGWLWLHPGAGAGRFAKPVPLSASGESFQQVAVVGDLTGDARPDLVGLRTDGYLYVAASRAGGKVGAFVRNRYLGTQYDSVVAAARDLTGDSRGDLVIRSSRTGELKILAGASGGTFGQALGPFAGAAGLSRLSTAQVLGSSQSDVVGVNSAGNRLMVLEHNGQVNLKPALPGNLSRTDIVQVLNVGDWNGDGKGDVITRQSQGDSLVLRPGNGNGQFASGRVMGYGWRTFVSLAAVGDITGDKDPDLVGRTRTGETTIFPGNGSRGFEAPVLAPSLARSFNLIGSGSWRPQQLPGSAYVSSDGSFVPFVGTGAGDLSGYDWVIGPGDLDGDGQQDLVGRDSAGLLWLLPGTAQGLAPRRFLASGFGGYTAGG